MESVISDLPRSVKLGTILTALTPQLRLLQLECAVNPPKAWNVLFQKSDKITKIGFLFDLIYTYTIYTTKHQPAFPD